MVEKKEKPEAAAPKAKTAPKKAVAPKAEAAPKKETAPKEAPAKAAVPKKEVKALAASGKTLKVIQIASPIGRQQYQRATLIGLGLNKIRRTKTLQDTPAVRGMIERVKHLIKVVE